MELSLTEEELNLPNDELIKLIRTLVPEQIARELVSVQPMDDVDYVAVMKALENYQWVCPCFGKVFNK